MPMKGLSGEQLYDSISQATGFRREVNDPRFFFNDNSPRRQFLAKFGAQEKRTEFQTSILQALSLMNGQFVADATHLDRSSTLGAVVDAPFLSREQKIETLYLAALGRNPRPDEISRILKYVANGGVQKNEKTALGDVFWALLNSSEFILNH
jgi:hypothetical protein